MARGATGAPRGAAELLDDAVHLVRRIGAAVLTTWCIGTVPFVLGLLFFWIEMRFGAHARDRLFALSGLVAVSYLWMKAWQSVFAVKLRQTVEGSTNRRRTSAEWLQLVLVQARYQPTSLLALPLAALAIIPFGWVYAFYHSLAVTGDLRQARRSAARWQMQNHAVIAIVALCSMVVFVNIFSAILLAPWLGQMLLGVSTEISRNPWLLFNSTTMVATGCLTYLVLGPVVKAAYVLRCFDVESRSTGADLRHRLAEIQARGGQ
jgi:hypothetical protein